MITPLKIQRIDSRQANVRQVLAELRERLSPRGNVVSEASRQRTIDVFGEPLSASQVVERICHDVRSRGLPAVLDYSARLDKAQLTAASLRVPAADLAAAHRAADPKLLQTLRQIKARILEFQRAILHHDVTIERPDGSRLTQRYVPLDRVGICVPGGAAAYPSTVLMTAVPAQAAGVKELAVIAPPTPFGAYNPDLLATCHELGIDEVYRVGGAQGVAALAYGVEGIRPVDKIVGPGNLFVALAKKHVFGEVDIDAIAGPSEVVVIADDSTPANFVAADLIAQAEHAPGASVLVTWSPGLVERVADELARQLAVTDRAAEARHSLEQFGALILVADAAEGASLANELAPEHLHIACQDAELLAAKIRHAGAIFLGNYTPVAVGDYVAGPSHVLPTGGTARFASGLSANDFLRAGSVIHYTREALAGVADDIRRLADKEGLAAHRASVDVRLESRPDQSKK